PTSRSDSVLACRAFFFSSLPPPPSSTLFPYTTLFRSIGSLEPDSISSVAPTRGCRERLAFLSSANTAAASVELTSEPSSMASSRSEEHTSELQSRENLVCRLLLEKKKQYRDVQIRHGI